MMLIAARMVGRRNVYGRMFALAVDDEALGFDTVVVLTEVEGFFRVVVRGRRRLLLASKFWTEVVRVEVEDAECE